MVVLQLVQPRTGVAVVVKLSKMGSEETEQFCRHVELFAPTWPQ